MTEMFAVPAAAAALLHPAALRQRKRCFVYNRGNDLEPRRAQARGIDGDAAIDQRALAVVVTEHLAGKGPEIVDGGLRTGMAFLGAIAEADHPFRRLPRV